MAYSAAFRRAAPIAARAFGGSRLIHRSALLRPQFLGKIIARETLEPRAVLGPLFASLSNFSTKASLAKKSSFDAELLKVIESEIKCAEECDDHDRVEEIPKGFPFEIQDEKGTNILTLKRSFHGENIEVIVSMPSLVTGEEPEGNGEADNDNEEDGGDDEKPSQSSIPLTVTVSKVEGLSLEFSCTAYPDEVVIDALSVKENKQSDEEMIAYEGPDFNDLDENLQKAFLKYLELRGISAGTTNLLHEYMINKDSREYLLWLKNLKQFVEK